MQLHTLQLFNLCWTHNNKSYISGKADMGGARSGTWTHSHHRTPSPTAAEHLQSLREAGHDALP